MKKLLISTLLLGSLFANDSYYVGIGAVNGNGTETSSNELLMDSSDDTISGGSIKLGYSFDGFITSENRIEFSFNSFNIDYDNPKKEDDTYAGVDFKYLLVGGLESLKFFGGPSVGYYKSDTKEGVYKNTGETDTASAAALGMTVGIYYDISSIELELSYQYNYLKWNYADFDLEDELNNLYAGINLKF